MQSGKPYILFCAGEDSGDCIGESLITQAIAACDHLQKSYEFRGAGGFRMQQAGLQPLVDFETLPVSGFGDVLPKYLQLRKHYKVLETALISADCKGLVSVDYPGFNMRLVTLAKKLKKPVLYVAPPQIWAWKSHRAKLFAGCENISLATFFDFEIEAYKNANCNVVKMVHPFANSVLQANVSGEDCLSTKRNKILLLPGSRKSQALRNISAFLDVVNKCEQDAFLHSKNVVLLAARDSLVPIFEKALARFYSASKLKVSVCVSPKTAEERIDLFRSAEISISAPGTATLELALSGCPMVVCTKPDFLTMVLAKRSVKTKFFALPNIILQRAVFPEFITRTFDFQTLAEVVDAVKKMTVAAPSFSKVLLQNLQADYNSEKLMSEFLAKLV